MQRVTQWTWLPAPVGRILSYIHLFLLISERDSHLSERHSHKKCASSYEQMQRHIHPNSSPSFRKCNSIVTLKVTPYFPGDTFTVAHHCASLCIWAPLCIRSSLNITMLHCALHMHCYINMHGLNFNKRPTGNPRSSTEKEQSDWKSRCDSRCASIVANLEALVQCHFEWVIKYSPCLYLTIIHCICIWCNVYTYHTTCTYIVWRYISVHWFPFSKQHTPKWTNM